MRGNDKVPHDQHRPVFIGLQRLRDRWTSFVGVSTNTFGMTTAEAEALVPAICLAIWLSEQRTEIEEEAREEELSRLSTEVPYQHRLL